MSQRLSRYIAPFDYFDKSLIVLSAPSGSISIAPFATVIGAPVGIPTASFRTFIFNIYRNYKEIVKNKLK